MIDRLLRKLRARDDVDAIEEAALREMVSVTKDIPADRTVIRADVQLDACMLLVSGLMCRFKDLPTAFARSPNCTWRVTSRTFTA